MIGQLRIIKSRSVGDIAASNGIADICRDGHGILLHPQRHIFTSGDGFPVVIGERDGDLCGVGEAGAILFRLSHLGNCDGELIEIVSANRILGDILHGKGLHILNVAEIVHAPGVRVLNGIQRRLNDILGRNQGAPIGRVAAAADGAGGNHHIPGGFRQIGAGPAQERIAFAGGIVQRDFRTFHGVRAGILPVYVTAAQHIADGVGVDLPCRSQGHVTGGACGDTVNIAGDSVSRRRPAQEAIAPAGGFAKDDLAAFNIVGSRVGRIVLTAA